MDSGRPIARRRAGSQTSRRNSVTFTREASENSTRASVTSATTWTEGASTWMSSGPQSGFARRYPATAKTSGPVRLCRARAPETIAHPKTSRASARVVDSVTDRRYVHAEQRTSPRSGELPVAIVAG